MSKEIPRPVARTWQLIGQRWLTAMDAARSGGCMSLAQRVSVWRRQGHVIIDKWVEIGPGRKVKAYKRLRPTGWTA